MRITCLILGLLVLQHQEVKAWGAEGHSIVAEIAQRNLSPTARARIAELFPNGASAASLSFWADEIRDSLDQSNNWHFVSIPLDQTNYDENRDCFATPRGDCVIKAIERVRKTLADSSALVSTRREALKFLVHFVGDLHQPLHTVKDRGGGAGFLLRFFVNVPKRETVATNLHWVWDTGLIRASFRSWGSYVDFLEDRWLPGRNVDELTRGTTVEWALDAHRVAIDVAFASITPGSELGEEYLERARPHLDRQLAVAGLRLALILNETLK
jgi:nuclease S1